MTIHRFDAASTESLLPFDLLVGELERTVAEYSAGGINSPERLVTQLTAGGVMLSMPASAKDIAVHKLVNVCPSNFSRSLATINGEVVAYDATTGMSLFGLDGPTVTGRRTAAITLLAISRLRNGPPKAIAIIGTGKQASTHVQALSAVYPDSDLVVAGISSDEQEQFCARHTSSSVRPFVSRDWSGIDVVVTLTTSKTPVYAEAATANRVVIGVGAFTPDAAEVGRETVLASTVVVDDPVGARHEAGDLIQADVDWSGVISLGDVLKRGADFARPVFFKSVGCAAWDLAACRVAREVMAEGMSG